jgi:regulatory protein
LAVVTGLDPETKGGGVRVHLDGAAFGTVGAAEVAALGLARGRELGATEVQRLAQRSELFAARLVALKMLASRPLPSGELARRLERRGHARAAARGAVEELSSLGVVNDAEFARHYARTRARGGRWGPVRLVADLKRFGIAEREAQAAVAEALEREGLEQLALAREAAVRKLKSLRASQPAVLRRRLRAYLLRRGFAAGDVREVVREALPG